MDGMASVLIKQPHPKTVSSSSTPGVSLLEVLVSIAFLAVMVLPIYTAVQQGSRFSKQSYVKGSRTSLLYQQLGQYDPADPSLVTNANMASKAYWSEGGQQVPYLTKVDLSTATAMSRTLHTYIYKDDADALTSPVASLSTNLSTDTLFIDVGKTSTTLNATTNLTQNDSLGQSWMTDQAYDGTNKIPGFVDGGTVVSNTGLTMRNIEPSLISDQALYYTYRTGNPLSYAIDVENGIYWLVLYFTEPDTSVDAGSNSRVMDITTENGTFASRYSPYQALFGGANRYAVTLGKAVQVTDGTLNISLTPSAGSANDPVLMGLSLRRLIN